MNDFELTEEIIYCLTNIIQRKHKSQLEIHYNKKKRVPRVIGDQYRFRVCFRTMVEFGMRYSSSPGAITVKSHVKEVKAVVADKKHFVI